VQNFTVADLVQTTLAALAFALFLLPSGYLLGMASDAFGMRSRSAAGKIVFSAAFSFAATPILAVLSIRLFSYRITLAFFLLLAGLSMATLAWQLPLRRRLSGFRRSTWILLCMMLAWFLVVQFSLADLQIGQRLYVSFVAFDHSVRVPFVEAAARCGVPPGNPFYGLGNVPVLRYFYYWYVVCALPMRLCGLSAKACLDASIFWSGLGLASTIPLFLKYFLGETEHLREKSAIGIALLAVTGLDLLPYAAMVYRDREFLPDMEWWDPNQVTSWLGSLLWVPHHVASLTACMAGLLALSSIEEDAPLRKTVWAAVLSGLAFASAAGLSIYVTLTFAVFAILWALQTLWQKNIKTFAAYIATGAFALILSWPYLLDLLSKQVSAGAGGVSGSGERIAFFAIRDYPPATELLGKIGVDNPLLLELAKLPVLLIVYFLEFGFFALIMMLCLRRDRRNSVRLSRQRRMGWTMFAVCLLTMSVLKSAATSQNDLGFRGMLVVQIVLLIWAAPMVHDYFFAVDSAEPLGLDAPWIRIALISTLVIGVAGTTCQLVLLRCYTPLADAGKVKRTELYFGAPGFGKRTYWLREGFGRLGQLTPPMATVQYNPVRDEVLISHLYSPRQAVMGDAFCGSGFGGDVEKCRQAFPTIAKVFNDPDAVRKWNLDKFCDDYKVNVLLATDADPVWKDLESWVWHRPNLLANPSMRAVACGTASVPR
jgi:hypothetical protein